MKLPRVFNTFRTTMGEFETQVARSIFNNTPVKLRIKDAKTTEPYASDWTEYSKAPQKLDIKYVDDKRPYTINTVMEKDTITGSYKDEGAVRIKFTVDDDVLHVTKIIAIDDQKVAQKVMPYVMQQLVNYADSKKLTIVARRDEAVEMHQFFGVDNRNSVIFEREPLTPSIAKHNLDKIKQTVEDKHFMEYYDVKKQLPKVPKDEIE